MFGRLAAAARRPAGPAAPARSPSRPPIGIMATWVVGRRSGLPPLRRFTPSLRHTRRSDRRQNKHRARPSRPDALIGSHRCKADGLVLGEPPPTACRRSVSGLFHSPLGVLFTFPSRYLCAIGRQGVLRLGGWSPHVQTGFHVSRPTRGPASRLPVRGCHPLWPAFPDGSG